MDEVNAEANSDDVAWEEKRRTGILGRTLAARLGETAETPIKSVVHALRALGDARTLALVDEACAVHAGDGLYYEKMGVRIRRTLGGTFFALAMAAGWIRPIPYEAWLRQRRTAARLARGDASAPVVPPVNEPPAPRTPREPPVVHRPLSGDARTMAHGKLEVTIKVKELPTKVGDRPNGYRAYAVACDGRIVTFTLRPKAHVKLDEIAGKGVPFVVSITGKMGAATPKGFELEEPVVQVFELKPKTSAPLSG